MHRRLLPLISAIMSPGAPNPIGVKHALNGVGFRVGGVRLPLVEADERDGRADHGGGAAAAGGPGRRSLRRGLRT